MREEFGRGRCDDYVGLLLKEVYGRHNAGRAFSREVLLWFEFLAGASDIDVRIFISDRCIITIKWRGEFFVILIHVDDGLAWYTAESILHEVLRRMRQRFILEVQETTTYCGIDVVSDPGKQLVKFSQKWHLELMLEVWGMQGHNPVRQPSMSGAAGASALQPWTGVPTPRETFDYAMLIGDLVWLTKTMKSITWAVHCLAQHIRCPGPPHVQAAIHLLRYVKHARDVELTLDGSDKALTEGWDRRLKVVIKFDAALPLPGKIGTTGIAAYINGGCFSALSRKQRTISNNSCEAETKAADTASQLGKGYRNLLAELLEVWPAATILEGDCRGSVKKVEKRTDTKSSVSFKRSLASIEQDVGDGSSVFNLVPREFNDADNMTQQGSPFED